MKKIILALDEIKNIEDAVSLVKKVGHLVYAVKIHDLYDKFGPSVIGMLRGAGAEKVWVDFKIYDIPNTSKLRSSNISGDIISVHASGGVEMMKNAVSSGKEIFAVTVLTSFSVEEVKKIYNRELNEVVLDLAKLAKEAGVSGIVCSPKEVKMLRNVEELNNLKLIVPGVRSPGATHNDQNRVGTPVQTLEDGADYLVIGRQITQSSDPEKELKKIQEEITNFI